MAFSPHSPQEIHALSVVLATSVLIVIVCGPFWGGQVVALLWVAATLQGGS